MIVPMDAIGLLGLIYVVFGFFVVRAYWHDSKMPRETETFWEENNVAEVQDIEVHEVL